MSKVDQSYGGRMMQMRSLQLKAQAVVAGRRTLKLRSRVLTTAAILAGAAATGCGGAPAEPTSFDRLLPEIPLQWSVRSDTTPELPFPLPSTRKRIQHQTKEFSVSANALLSVSCSYVIGDQPTPQPAAVISLELRSGVFPSGPIPLIWTEWSPPDASSAPQAIPQLVWQVPTLLPWTASLPEPYATTFRETIKVKQGVKWYWTSGAGGSPVELVFDVRRLSAAIATIQERCRV